jgi:transcriptional regulator with XRE-family HTH domain
MDNRKFGAMIAAMRKENAMTQKDLAERLGVSSMAVARWEKGKGYPEISLLPLMSEVLGISPGELLSGERNPAGYQPPEEEDALVTDMIEYAEKITRYKSSGIAFSMLTMVFVTALLICLLVNFLINRRFDWSLYPLGAIVMIWLTMAPIFFMKKFKILMSCLFFLSTSMGYLFLIELIGPAKDWVLPLAIPILMVSVLPLIAIYLLFRYTRINRLRLMSFSFLIIGVLVNIGIHLIVRNYVGRNIESASVIITALVFVLLSAIPAVAGEINKHRDASGTAEETKPGAEPERKD